MALANSSGFVFLFYLVLLFKSADSKCEKSFNCGFLGSLDFPLADNTACGLVMVNCSLSPPIIQLKAGGPSYVIDQKISTNKFLVYDTYLERQLMNYSHRCHSIQNGSLPDLPYISFAISPNITILSCSKSLDPNDRGRIQGYFGDYTTYTACENFDFYYADPPHASPKGESSIPEHCSIVLMPVKPDYDQSKGDLFQLFYPQFNLEWHVSADCLSCHSGGKCRLNTNNEFRCQGRGKTTHKKRILLIGGVATISLISTSMFLFLAIRRKFTIHKLRRPQKETIETRSTIELYLKNNGNLAPRRYKYSDLKKMTKSFHEKLGQGGYGSVYKGKLPDGHLVAVKILSEVSRNGEEFMNEVTSISRTSHINIVTLLGYCLEGSKRALVYQFMPNGSLENFIQNNTSSPRAKDGLGWEKLLDIAVGTARGLEYLHQGCNMRILHFDIKPHNILLDNDMNPKISDFGLAKLCPNRSSTVSMLVARGTIGYIAPEIFCRNFGEVSHKSDVYSYGIMILEMALGRQNLDRQANQSSEMYFPNWIYKQLEVNVIAGLDTITNEDEWEIAKKMIIVGLWCIRTEPRNRPSISKVVEMLTGSLDSLEIPPWPYLSSPPRPAPDASSASEPSTIQHNSLLPQLSSPDNAGDN